MAVDCKGRKRVGEKVREWGRVVGRKGELLCACV
jgi:hypothetical protein